MSKRPCSLVALDSFPRLGWIEKPSPVTAMPDLARSLGLEWLGAKRDDQCAVFPGGSKIRKLDYLLASEPFASASRWISMGAIGSGQLVACSEAARRLGRSHEVFVFWEPLSSGVLDNLAFTALHAAKLRYYPGRVSCFLRHRLSGIGEGAVIPPGASCPTAMLGLVRAGLELAAQVEAGLLPELSRLYVPLGSAGTALGLLAGLALGGLKTQIHAISVVEKFLSTRRRLRRLLGALKKLLISANIPEARELDLERLVIDRRYLGQGYGRASAESLAACHRLKEHGLTLEPIYSGKAMAALLSDAKKNISGAVLFWNTFRGPLPPPREGWQERLPRKLRRRLKMAETSSGPTRRIFLLGGAGLALAGAVAVRITGYPDLPDWKGKVLRPWQALVLMAAAEALLPPLLGDPDFAGVAANVDAYLVGMPKGFLRQIDLLFWVIEQGTTPLGLRVSRFTELQPQAREEYLSGLAAWGGPLGEAYRGLRDLCMIGYYQQDAAWKGMGYEGPWIKDSQKPDDPYRRLLASPGSLPQGASP